MIHVRNTAAASCSLDTDPVSEEQEASFLSTIFLLETHTNNINVANPRCHTEAMSNTFVLIIWSVFGCALASNIFFRDRSKVKEYSYFFFWFIENIRLLDFLHTSVTSNQVESTIISIPTTSPSVAQPRWARARNFIEFLRQFISDDTCIRQWALHNDWKECMC